VIAIMSGLYWGLIADAGAARVLTHVIGVMVIACPCALGLAVPAAVMLGSAAALKRGILVKHGAALEVLPKLNRVVFDKTGTLTTGKPKLAAIALAPGVHERQAASALALVGASSLHPLARSAAVWAEANGAGVSAAAASADEQPGRGVKVFDGQATFRFGVAEFAATKSSAELAAELSARARAEAGDGASISILSGPDGVLAACAFTDELRSEAAATVAWLHARGVKTTLLSGDHEAAARAVAAKLGISDVIASAKPADKVAAIGAIRARGESVAMVGDGINDAPAMSAATLGIAIGSGTGMARASGDIVLMGGGIAGLRRAVEIAETTRKGIRQNLFFSLCYNVVGIPLAAGVAALFWPGVVIPASYAALSMVASDVSLAANCARLNRALKRV
jgi:Cu+-exporting ATPase